MRWAFSEISVGLDHNLPSRTVSAEGVREALQAAVESWNGIPELPLRFVIMDTPDPAVRVRFCKDSWRGDAEDLGKAVFTADVHTGAVSSAVIEINECGRAFLAPAEAQDGRFDLQAVLTHELGHVLGLGHSDNPEAIMSSKSGSAGIRSPKPEDRAAIALVYDTALVIQSSPSIAPRAAVGLPAHPFSEMRSQSEETSPDQVLTAMRVADAEGRSLVIFTCEPTLLPPISSQENAPPPELRRDRKRRAAHVPARP